MKKIKSIPVLSFLFTCLLVLYHVNISTPAVSEPDRIIKSWIVSMNGRTAEIALSYFFGVTGFLLFYNMTTIKSCFIKIKKRIFSLFVPYLFWQFLFVGVFYLTHRYTTGEDFINCLGKMFLFKGYPPDIPLWYVYTVFVWAFLSPLFWLIFKNKKIGFASLIVLFAALYFVMTAEVCAPFAKHGIVWLALKYSFAYLAGAFYGLHFPDAKDRDSLKYIALALLICFAISAMWFDDIKTSVLMAAFPILLLKFFPERLCKDRKIYKISFIMLAIHYPLYQYLADAVKKLNFAVTPASLVNIMFRVTFLAAIIGLSYLIYSLLSRFAPIVLKIITGGRE